MKSKVTYREKDLRRNKRKRQTSDEDETGLNFGAENSWSAFTACMELRNGETRSREQGAETEVEFHLVLSVTKVCQGGIQVEALPILPHLSPIVYV